MKRTLFASAAALVFSAIALQAQADNNAVESRLEVATVVEASEGETLEPARTITPGAVLQYSLDYTNRSETGLDGFTIVGPIPENTTFLLETERADRRSVFEAKVEGLDWAQPPITRYETDGDGVVHSVIVPASEYAAVRWRLAEPLEPGGSASAAYRVRVAN